MSTINDSKAHLQEVLRLLGVDAEISIEEIGGEASLQVQTQDQAVLIGRGGENLKALQYIVAQMVKSENSEAQMVTIDVAGYRKQRLKRLEVMVNLAKAQALNSDEPVKLTPMNAYERRYVHSLLSDEEGLRTESSGIEPDRRIIIHKAS